MTSKPIGLRVRAGGVVLTTVGQFRDRHYTRKHRIMNRLLCRDGFHFSAQASRDHYCAPRLNLSSGSEYTAWEVGFPSAPEPLFEPYAECSAEYPDCTYPYTPTNVVDAVIMKHGGLVTDEEHQVWWWVEAQGGGS